MTKRVLAIDPGDKRIGVAISDESGSIARPLTVIVHTSRMVDAASIAQVAFENGVSRIIVGQALDSENRVTPQGRKSNRLADAIRDQTNIPVLLWDEGNSTQTAKSIRLDMGTKRKKRVGHQDDKAAAVILQDYLDSEENIT